MKNFFKSFAENNLTEIVFKNRNKSYGAYELRKHYDERLSKAILFIVGFFVIPIFFFGIIFKNKESIQLILSGNTPQDTAIRTSPTPEFEKPKPAIQQRQNNSTEIYPVIVSDTVQQRIDVHDTASFVHGSPTGTPTGASSDSVTGTLPMATAPLVVQPDTGIIIWADKMPEFPGGEDALMQYLNEHMSNAYTPLAIELHAEGKVLISFVVDMKGKIKNVKILSDKIGYGCAENASMIVGDMPDWIPGINHNVTVNVRVVLPVNFKLRDN